MPHENPLPEGLMAPMERSEQHRRFRALFSDVVASRRLHHPDIAEKDRIVRCYDSQAFFEAYFPDAQACEEMLREILAGACERRDIGPKKLDLIERYGLSYEDRKALMLMPDIEETMDQ